MQLSSRNGNLNPGARNLFTTSHFCYPRGATVFVLTRTHRHTSIFSSWYVICFKLIVLITINYYKYKCWGWPLTNNMAVSPRNHLRVSGVNQFSLLNESEKKAAQIQPASLVASESTELDCSGCSLCITTWHFRNGNLQSKFPKDLRPRLLTFFFSPTFLGK